MSYVYKKRQIQAKQNSTIGRERCPSQLNTRVFSENIKNLAVFSKSNRSSHYCDTVKRKEQLKKMGKDAKITNRNKIGKAQKSIVFLKQQMFSIFIKKTKNFNRMSRQYLGTS